MDSSVKKTILLVEDEEIIAMAEALTLGRLGYEVVTVNSGKKAVEYAVLNESVSLVLMDMNLGKGIDGTEAARLILAERNIPIVFLTAHAEQEMVERVRGITRYGYVIKNSGDFVLQSSIEMAFELFGAHKKIIESDQRFRAIFNSSFQFTGLLSPDGTLLEANKTALDFAGIGIEDVKGRPYWELPWWAGDESLVETLKMAVGRAASGEFVRYETEIQGGGNRRIIIDFSLKPVLDTDGKVVLLIPEGRDITERKKSEDDLRESENRMKSIFSAAPIGIGTVLNRCLTKANDRLCEMTGYQCEELIGQSARILYPGDEEFNYVGTEKYRQISEKGTGTVETRWLRKDGTIIDVLLSSTPIDSADLSHGVTFTALDITERKTGETALRESEEHLRQISESISIVYYVQDRALSRFVYVSPSYENVWGRPLRELMEDPYSFSYSIHSDDRDRVFEAIKRELENEEYFHSEYRIIRPDGEIRWIRSRNYPIFNEEGRVYRVAGFAEDITDRMLSDQWIAKLNERFLQFGSDPVANINLLVSLCGEMFGATCALYNRLEDGSLCSIGGWNTPPDFTLSDQSDGHICADVIKSRDDGTFVIRNLQDSGYVRTDPNVRLYHLQTYIGRAVKCLGENVGSLCVVFQRDFVPVENEKRVMGIIASAIGVEEDRGLAEERIKTLLAEKEIVLKEVHHRIKNNMNTVMGLLSLQSRTLENSEAIKALQNAHGRIQTMTMLFDKLYFSDGIDRISLREYLPALIDEIHSIFPNRESVKIKNEIDDFIVDPKLLSSIGIIINELITNAMKYAFVGREEGSIAVSVSSDNDRITIVVRDDGIGIPDAIDALSPDSFGLQLIAMLVGRMDGTVKVDRSGGTAFTIRFRI